MCIGTSIASRHNLSYSALVDILRSYNFIVGQRVIPDTKYLVMKKIFATESDEINYHVFCHNCTKYLGTCSNIQKDLTCQCGIQVDPLAPQSYFLELDISKQMEKLLSNEEIVKDIEKGISKFDGNPRDITDGKIHREYRQNIKKGFWDLSYTINTDGCQPDDSSNFSASKKETYHISRSVVSKG